jgi:hypothetical protein
MEGFLMPETALYLQTETSLFMMSIVIKTASGNAIVIDGGQPEDLPLLRDIIGDNHVKAWFLTHPHFDHITGFMKMISDDEISLWPDKVYYNFPSLEFMEKTEPNESWTLRDFLEIEEKIKDRAVIVKEGDSFEIDELKFNILQSYEENNPIVPLRPKDENSTGNENSLVFKINGPNKSVLILGDTGPLGGDRLFARHWQDLKSDIVQMAHHGHSGVGAEVYIAAEPKACLWCCRDWLYDEHPFVLSDRLCGTVMTRKWMDAIGVKEHYVTKDGTHKILI